MTAPLRFLQLSDVHFGARLTCGRLRLSAAAAERRSVERRDGFRRAMAIVRERRLDGVLIPGDLFDDESVDSDTLRFVQHQLGSIEPAPVFLAPGNHDPYGGTSPYRALEDGDARGLRWPGNVILFAHEAFRTVSWPGRDDVRVTGCGVAANVPVQSRRLGSRIRRSGAKWELLLFHGSRDDGEWLQAHKATQPFSRDELLAQGFDWVALGHYHQHQLVHDESGRARAAYSGALLAGGLDEPGSHGCLVVEIHPDRTDVEQITLDPRRVHDVPCDLSGCGFREQAAERIEGTLRSAQARADDLIVLRLTGRRACGLDLGFLDQLRERYFHLDVDASELRPDVDLEQYLALDEASTVEERFVARLRSQLEGENAEVARRALLYGLDALTRSRIEPLYEE